MALVTSSPAIDRVLSRLEGVRPSGEGKWMALCPSHEDRERSLSITIGRDGRVLAHCHAGCEPAAIVGAIGLTMSDLFAEPRSANGSVASPAGAPASANGVHAQKAPGVETRRRLVASYDYVGPDGALLFQSCRFEPKKFTQRRRAPSGEWIYDLKGVSPVLYRLPDVLEAVAHERRVFVVEGEKDADALIDLGYAATTNPMGAGKWREPYSDVLAGADIVVLPDNDEPGRAHARDVARSLHARNASVRIVTLPGVAEKGDVSDWLDAGHDVDELEQLIEAAPLWVPDQTHRTRWRLDELWQSKDVMQPPPPVVPYLAWGARTTLLAAREKSGKSTLTGYMAARVSLGAEFLGEPCQRGPVLIIGLEEFLGDTARRLKQFGADGRMIFIVDRFASEPAHRPSEVRAHVEAVRPVLVIVDSLVAYAQGIVTDANNATQTQSVVQALTDLSHQTAVALVIIHHARKADGKYRDSSAIGGAVDIIAEVFPPDETTDPNRRRVRPIGRVPARSVDFRFTEGHGYELVDPSGPIKAPLDQRIIAIVTDRPGCSANDVVDALGEQRRIVLTRITQMLSGGLLRNDGFNNRMKLVVPIYQPRKTGGSGVVPSSNSSGGFL